MKFYDKKNTRIIFISDAPTKSFWSAKWLKSDLKNVLDKRVNSFVVSYTKKYLQKGAKLLEGGCGIGVQVNALTKSGYKCTGIDFAKNVVDRVNALHYPFKLDCGDVKNLPYSNNTFDGYWSLGVIEHFWEGYQQIAKEMFRVLKPNGYLFVTFPMFSSLRALKAFLGIYPKFNDETCPQNFYQFGLSSKIVISDFEKIGFQLVEKKHMDAVKGIKDELYILSNSLQKIYDSKQTFMRGLRFLINALFSRNCGHTVLLVFVKSR